MEQNFQTSFIPKKPIIKERASSPRPVGIYMIIAIFALFASLLLTGGLFFYKNIQEKSIVKMEKSLEVAKERFEPVKLAELQALDKRLRASNEILANHISVTPIFDLLEKVTMKSVRFTKFNYSIPEDVGAPIIVTMSGVAQGYRSVALQSDLFAKNNNLIDPVFSNLTLDQNANVLFDLEFGIDPSFINYKRTLPAPNTNI